MRKKIWLIVLALFLGLIASVIYIEWANTHKRKQNLTLTKGNIVDVRSEIMDGSHAADITYMIKIDGKDIIRTTRITCEKSNILFMLMNKQMDVVYEKNNPENCELLLNRSSYREYKLLLSKDVLQVLEAMKVTCGAIN
jgi:hypothetical protein